MEEPKQNSKDEENIKRESINKKRKSLNNRRESINKITSPIYESYLEKKARNIF